MHNPNATGRVAEWGIKLQAFNLEFVTTKTIKSRALAEFLAKSTLSVTSKAKEQSTLPRHEDPKHWVMYFDGTFSLQGAGARVVFTSPTGDQMFYVVQLDFKDNKVSNNIAEYEGLMAGLKATISHKIK